MNGDCSGYTLRDNTNTYCGDTVSLKQDRKNQSIKRTWTSAELKSGKGKGKRFLFSPKRTS